MTIRRNPAARLVAQRRARLRVRRILRGHAARAQAALLVVALLGQMLLPAAHAIERRQVEREARLSAPAAAASSAPSLAAAPPPQAARHDAAACAVCRSLTHASPAIVGVVALVLRTASPDAVAAPLADRLAHAARRAHPPRAPPAARSVRHPVV